MIDKHTPVAIFWFRRDLRINDNTGFYHALLSKLKVVPIFVFDHQIIGELAPDDARVTFIYKCLQKLNKKFNEFNSSLVLKKGDVLEIWRELIAEFTIHEVYINSDYEPYGIKRDGAVEELLNNHKIVLHRFNDHLIMEPNEVLKMDANPYTVYTPYARAWLNNFTQAHIHEYKSESKLSQLVNNGKSNIPKLEAFGFSKSTIKVPLYNLSEALIANYDHERDIPDNESTSMLGPHLRFGVVSPRQVIRTIGHAPSVFLKQLIWREFFIQILANFPHVVTESFKNKYNNIQWENNAEYFEKWCKGETGYPMVDAGIKQLNATGFMHNRVRMLTASFLCKHLLIDWRWGEAYFASKLLDFELASNNGNWQWVAGSGCDAAPYFRVFNPNLQQQKFDPEFKYIKKWVPNYDTPEYPKPIVDHKIAREKVLKLYKSALNLRSD